MYNIIVRYSFLVESAFVVVFSAILLQHVLVTVLVDNLDTATVPVVPFVLFVPDDEAHVLAQVFWHPVVALVQPGFVVVVVFVVPVLLLSFVVTVVVVVEVWA